MRTHDAAHQLDTGGGRIIEGGAIIVALPALAEQINAEHAAAMEHARSAVQRARHAGELLLQAKQQCAHGDWLPWLRCHCPDISERTVQGYMRLARHCLENPEQAAEIETLTLRNALAQLAAPIESTPIEKRNAVADLTEFDPRTFKQRMTEIDENIERVAARLWSDFQIATAGLSGREKKAAWMVAIDASPPEIPVEPGRVTIGCIAGVPVYALIESRRYPGFWHDIDLRQSSFSTRPIKPLGLKWHLGAAASACDWLTSPDDGSLIGVVGEHTAREAVE